MEVIWLLDGTTLSGLRRATQRSSGGGGGAGGRARVPLEAFVTEFYRALCFGSGNSDHGAKGRSQARTRQLVERVCVLFDLVDVDSAGVIDWVDFTDFCVYIRGRDSGNQGVQAEPGAPTSEPKRVQDSEITRFTEKLGYIDRSSHCHEVGLPFSVTWYAVVLFTTVIPVRIVWIRRPIEYSYCGRSQAKLVCHSPSFGAVMLLVLVLGDPLLVQSRHY